MALVEHFIEAGSLHAAEFRTLQRMLARPVLPTPPGQGQQSVAYDAAVRAICFACDMPPSTAMVAYRGLWAHLNKPPAPKTKTVEVWRVEYAQRASNEHPWWPYTSTAFWHRADAEKFAADRAGFSGVACIRITGPHQQEIPA